MSRPITVFFSYSHKDEEYRNELEVHLAPLKRQGIIETWHDRRISAGKEVHNEISQNLESADLILLLVSPYFIASDYCYDKEMTRALERHSEGAARVIPVIVHPCEWHDMPFGTLRATPLDGKPLSKFPNGHEGFVEVVKDIKSAAAELGVHANPPRESRPSVSAPAPPELLRSSNLRVRKEFTEREKDDFLDASFEYVANFFENSLAEVGARNDDVQTRYKRTDATHFTAAIYRREKKVASCRIWLSARDRFGGEIRYNSSDSGHDDAYNESMSVIDDGYQLLLKPLGLTIGQSFPSTASQHGAAEFLWSLFIGGVQ